MAIAALSGSTAKQIECSLEASEITGQEFVRIYHINEITDRALFAEQAKLSEYRSILFKLYDRRPYADIIWKQIRPVYSKPFKDGYEYVT